MRLAFTALAALAAASGATASLSDKAADALISDPFPSLREKGDTLFTALAAKFADNNTLLGNKTAVKEAVNVATHKASNAIHDAKSPLAGAAYNAFLDLAAKEANHTARGGCDPAARKKKAGGGLLPLSFAFQGTGNLFPFETGVVSGLYARGVLTPEVARAAHFGGLSGGGVTSVLTALGFTAEEQQQVAEAVFLAIKACLDSQPPNECKQWPLTVPILKEKILAKDPDAVHSLSGRLTLWTCQVDALSDSNKHSVAQGTSKWHSIDDLLTNMRASGSIPCRTIPGPYTAFRGNAYIDGAFCSDFAQLCPKVTAVPEAPGVKVPSKCLKTSADFLGPNLSGSPRPTADTCKYFTPPDILPNVGKPYLTPSDAALWAPRAGYCANGAPAEKVPFVAQGTTAKPDIFPFAYSALPLGVFPSACDFLNSAARANDLNQVAGLFDAGRAAAIGWAEENGYCA